MKHQLIRITGIFGFMLLAVTATAGTWSANKFFYEPALDARGATEKDNFDAGLNRVDAHVGKYKTLGDPDYSTLAEALTTIGTSTPVTLTIPAGTVAVTSNITIGNNIALRIQKGGKFDVSSGVTLTINGPIDAGPYQIFSGSGTVMLGGVSTIYDAWYASPPTSPTSIAAPIGSRFVKTSGNAPIVYTKESGTGTTGWVASSGGSGATAFTGLNDVPSSYSGQTGKSLRVNSSANGLEFYSPSSSGGVKPFKTLGETGCTTLSEALTTIGSTSTTLVVPAETGALAVSSNTTIPANVDLRIYKGSKFDVANGVTLTINGSIEAGPYQIFSWTGTGKIIISGSPTKDIPVEWFGALKGLSNDISPALNKINPGTGSDIAVGCHQNIRLGAGIYRIASPVTWVPIPFYGGFPSGYGLLGEGPDSTFLVVATPGNAGLTIGIHNGWGGEGWRIKGINVVGDTNCCTYGVALYKVNYSDISLSFLVGATQYAFLISGCENNQFNVMFGNANHVIRYLGIPFGIAANGTYIVNDDAQYRNGTWNHMIHASGCGVALAGYGIHMTNTGDNWTITGDIENYDTGLKIDGDCKGITLSNLHFEGNKNYHFDIEDSALIILSNVKCATADIGRSLSKIKNIQGISITNSQLFQCTIYPGVTGTISNGEGWPGYGINDLTGGGIEYLGYRSYLYTSGEGINPGGLNKQNLLNNTFLDRWNAAGYPDGWSGVSASQTWTQCGVGKTDTTKFRTDYCGKIVTASGAGTVSTCRYLHSEPVSKWLLGKTITGAIQFMVPSGQTFTYDAATLYLQITVPNWASGTAYKAGDAVYANGNTMAVCVRPGTSGTSAPSWTSTVGAEFDEGTGKPLWVILSTLRSSNFACPTKTADAKGVWFQATASLFVPRNPTGIYYKIETNPQSAASGTIYFAEPALFIGLTPSTGIRQGKDEHEQFIQIGGLKITAGPTAAGTPTGWRRRGDQHWWTDPAAGQSPGVVATADGSPATWKPMPNLGN